MLDLAHLVKRFVELTADSQMCSAEKASTLGALVIGLRPKTVVEIGVWMGSSFLPMALAMRSYGVPGTHVCVAIDPWDPAASVEGQRNPKNVAWWGRVSHDKAHETFVQRVHELGLEPIVSVQRCRSEQADVPGRIDMLHIDGNHGEQAIGDVIRFAPNVPIGGIVVMDDIKWEAAERGTTAVELAVEKLCSLGFDKLYDLGTGAVFQRHA
jgi:predicted O-methyltransferase YrrM